MVQGALLRWDFTDVAGGKGDGRTDIVDTLGLRVLRNRRVVERMTGERMSDPGRQMQIVPFEVFGISGALPMYRRTAIVDVAFGDGVFDESFFSYKEGVDLAFRLRAAGWRAMVVPGARAWHDRTAAGPRSLSDHAAMDGRRSKSAFVRYHSYKNHLFVLLKNERFANFAHDWPWICWYELKKLIFLMLFDRATLRALRDVWERLPILRMKRRAMMAKCRVDSAELRRWFR